MLKAPKCELQLQREQQVWWVLREDACWGGEEAWFRKGRVWAECLAPGESSALEAQWLWRCCVLCGSQVTSCSNPV